MSSIVLPSRGQCIQITDSRQPCQCLWFFPPESPLLDQVGAHPPSPIFPRSLSPSTSAVGVDTVSALMSTTFQCLSISATARVQACTCSASLIEHMPVVNMYRSPTPLPYGAEALPSHVNAFTGDVTNIPFTPVPMPSPSTNDSPSYSYRDVVIFAPNPQPVSQTTIIQIDAHSHSEVENFYIAQYQNDNPSVVNNVPDSGARFHEDYSTTYVPVYGAEAWAGQIE
ncbi:hypothetical protein EDD85DRAFT_940797 [Armillaria nabsnona]|nr:hypothetical protein EDD85DRAFT_940797 [Armillaria nabsnona]